MDSFWKKMSGAYSRVDFDGVLLGEDVIRDPKFASVRNLTDAGRAANALPLPQKAGVRVQFVANLGSVLTYPEVPNSQIEGTIVTVKTAHGPCTDFDGRVFVSWDDGKFGSFYPEHLKLAPNNKKVARTVRRVVSSWDNLVGSFSIHGSDELVHKATKDLWAVKKNGDSIVIERLFDDTGKPLKE